MKINVIVPLWNRGFHIKPLMANIEDIVNKTNENQLKLWISDFKSTDINLNVEIAKYTYPIEIVLLDPPFIIGKGLQIAAEKIPSDANELIYFCDADSVFPLDIFARIRMSVQKNKTFYAPLVSRENKDGVVENSINKGGKGNIGIHVADFVRSRGWRYPKHMNCIPESVGPMERTAWGKHDTHIYEVFKKVIRLTPVRHVESDQWVRYHPRDTDGWFSNFEKELSKKIQKRGHRRR
jgi:glycosyltransferase involved in cell wall biosynthesis